MSPAKHQTCRSYMAREALTDNLYALLKMLFRDTNELWALLKHGTPAGAVLAIIDP